VVLATILGLKMFHKTSLRLTALYLAILMTISIIFSIAIYTLSVTEINRTFWRQNQIIEPLLRLPGRSSFRSEYIEDREHLLQELHNRVIIRLVFVNLLIMVGGGILSYLLARRTLEPIEAAHNSLERFTADASHELRTPITAMKTEIEVALSDPKLKLSEAKELLGSNLEELARLTALSEGLLRLSRPDDDEPELTKVDVVQTIKAVIDQFTPVAKAKKITFVIKLADKQFAKSNQHQLREVLMILLDNAIKFSPTGKKVTVTSSSARSVVISVKDEGPGISEADLPNIFERFYQADSSRTDSKGYGLGLAIAKRLTENLGGSITAENGKTGAIFTLTIPKL
jgi:signal transduction histidine kinase